MNEKLTPEQLLDKFLNKAIDMFGEDGELMIADAFNILSSLLPAHTTEDVDWLGEEGFCGTCAFFHQEPMCPGGICGFYPDKPQVKLTDSCEEYELDNEWENHFERLQQEDK